MTFISVATGVKELPASLSGIIDGVLVAEDETIKRRIE